MPDDEKDFGDEFDPKKKVHDDEFGEDEEDEDLSPSPLFAADDEDFPGYVGEEEETGY